MDTRTSILQKNFQAIYQTGFQATRTDKVIMDLGITKGAFYHYFPNKFVMGYAIVEEIIYPMFVNGWLLVQKSKQNAIDALIENIHRIENTATAQNIGLGCPLNNLIQEMSSIDEGFRTRLAKIVDIQLAIIEQIIQQGIEHQQVKNLIDAKSLSCFILAGIEGSFAVGKCKNCLQTFQSSIYGLIQFLKILKI